LPSSPSELTRSELTKTDIRQKPGFAGLFSFSEFSCFIAEHFSACHIFFVPYSCEVQPIALATLCACAGTHSRTID
jgi:hypothetical protein